MISGGLHHLNTHYHHIFRNLTNPSSLNMTTNMILGFFDSCYNLLSSTRNALNYEKSLKQLQSICCLLSAVTSFLTLIYNSTIRRIKLCAASKCHQHSLAHGLSLNYSATFSVAETSSIAQGHLGLYMIYDFPASITMMPNTCWLNQEVVHWPNHDTDYEAVAT